MINLIFSELQIHILDTLDSMAVSDGIIKAGARAGSFPLKRRAKTHLEMYHTCGLSMCGHVNYVLSLLIFSKHFFLEPKYISYFQSTYLKEKIVKNQQ